MARPTLSERHTARLVARARAGDAVAFGRLYDAYADRVYAFVRARIDSPHDAEDVTATVFLRVWESIGTYDERGVPFGAWLFRIARNATVDEYRRSGRRAIPTENIEYEESAAGPEDDVIASADAERIRQAVRMLSDEQAWTVALRFWWGLSLKETAEALGKNENAVKALQHRATRSLARILQEACDGDPA